MATGAERKCFQSSNKASLLMSYFWLNARRIPLWKVSLILHYFSTIPWRRTIYLTCFTWKSLLAEEKKWNKLRCHFFFFLLIPSSFICSVAFLSLTQCFDSIHEPFCVTSLEAYEFTVGHILTHTQADKALNFNSILLSSLNEFFFCLGESFDIVVLSKPQVPFLMVSDCDRVPKAVQLVPFVTVLLLNETFFWCQKISGTIFCPVFNNRHRITKAALQKSGCRSRSEVFV